MKSALSIFIVLLLCIAKSYSQDPFYINYTIDDGLPSNEVYDVEIDNNGLLWFTTDRGVSTYDSYNFKNYTTHDGLGDNVNFEIFKDSDGVLWFFGYNGKVTFYKEGKFKQYRYNKELIDLTKSIVGNYVKEIQQGLNNKLLISCNTQSQSGIMTISQNQEPSLVLAKNSHLEIDSSTFIFSKIHYTHKGGMHSLSTKKKHAKFILSIINEPNINFIYPDVKNFWFSDTSTKGLQKINSKNNSIDTIFHNYEITNIRKDYNNGYWISTTNKGIIYVANVNVSSMNINTNSNTKTNYLKLHCFQGNLICGTSNSTVIAIDSANNNYEIRLDNINPNENIDEIQTINNGQNLRIERQMVFAINRKTVFNKTTTTERGFFTSNNYIITRNRDGYNFRHENDLKSTYVEINGRATKIVEDNNSNLWIGSLNGLHLIEGFDYLNPQEIITKEKNKIGRVSDITTDLFNNIWVSTIGYGIFIIHPEGMQQFNTDNGLTTNIINTVEVIDSNEIWVATNDGLNLLSYSQSLDKLQFIQSFNQNDGLNTNYINDVIKWSEKIYVASPNGICSFSSNEIIKPSAETPIKINSIYVNDSLISDSKIIDLEYYENQIVINYKGIRYNKSKSQKLYKFKLEKGSQSRDWIYTNDTEAIFDDLEYGKYNFKVNACNKEGLWNKENQSISFSIRPHFTNTFLYRIFCILLITISILLIVYYFFRRYQQIKATELILEETRTRAKEAELSALRNQMNPHFIFNSLNTIQNFVFKKDVTKANYLLSKFSSLIRKSLNYSRLEAITIAEEIQFLEDYIELEKVRFPNLIKVNFEVDTKIDIELDKIPSLFLQPLIENSIKHGISKSNRLGEISVTFETLDNKYLKIFISDTGRGMTEKVKTDIKHVSLGHQILKDRVKILKSKGYPSTSFGVTKKTTALTPGYEVTLILPIL